MANPDQVFFNSSGVNCMSCKPWSSATAALTVLVCATAALIAIRVSAAELSKASACSASVYHQLDFWVGDWDAFDVDNPSRPVAHTTVTRILDGCVLLEVYEGTDGHIGQSFTIYDKTRNVWHQSWVTNQGSLLVIEGAMQAGEVILSGADRTKDGKNRRVRGIWKSIDAGVSESAFSSLDDGKTWVPWLDIVFRPHKAS